MKAPAPHARDFWRRALLRELGIEWRGPLPAAVPAAGRSEASGPGTDRPPAADTPPEAAELSSGRVVACEPAVPAASAEPAESTESTEPAKSVEPLPVEPAPAHSPAAAWHLAGKWRWSWWRGDGAVEQALLLRPADAPRPTDGAARDLLAAAMAAVGLTPVPRDHERPVGGVIGELDEKTLRSLAGRPWRPLRDQPLTVIVCLPPRLEHDLARQSGVAQAVPGGQWPLPGPPALRLVLLPSPERMLAEGAAAKRVAWRALAPLQSRLLPDSRGSRPR